MMAKLIMLILGWFTQHLIVTVFKYIFSGFIGLASYKFIKTLIDKYINSAISQLNGIGELSAVVNLAGFDTAISIILGAFAIRASIMAMGLVVVNPQGS